MKKYTPLASAYSGLAMLFLPMVFWINAAMKSYPKSFIALMVLLMGSSALLSFTVLRQPATLSAPSYSAAEIALSSQLPVNASALIEVLSLQAELKSFLDKDIPDQADSLKMEHILQRIQTLNHSIKSK